MEADGTITPIADRWDGKRLNRPNDVICRSDGTVYFTNPAGRLEPPEREMDFSGVHQVAPDGTVSILVADLEFPNGLALSPDERTLYVANTRQPTADQRLRSETRRVDSQRTALRGHVLRRAGRRPRWNESGRGRPGLLHRPRRLLGLRSRWAPSWNNSPARNPGQLRLGRPGPPDHVFHRPYFGLQPADENPGDQDTARRLMVQPLPVGE